MTDFYNKSLYTGCFKIKTFRTLKRVVRNVTRNKKIVLFVICFLKIIKKIRIDRRDFEIKLFFFFNLFIEW